YVIAAGGTGGHIFPGIALAREIRARRPEAEILFVGSRHGLEAKLVPEAGFALELVRASGFAGKRLSAKARALAELPAGFFGARRLDPSATTRRLLVFGGSQGSRVLNRAMTEAAPLLESDGIDVIHQAGEKEFDSVRARSGRPLPTGWRVEPFLPHIHRELA